MSLNAGKAKYVMFHIPQKHIKYPKCKIDEVEIKQVEDHNFLGIVIDEQLNWKSHAEYILK